MQVPWSHSRGLADHESHSDRIAPPTGGNVLGRNSIEGRTGKGIERGKMRSAHGRSNMVHRPASHWIRKRRLQICLERDVGSPSSRRGKRRQPEPAAEFALLAIRLHFQLNVGSHTACRRSVLSHPRRQTIRRTRRRGGRGILFHVLGYSRRSRTVLRRLPLKSSPRRAPVQRRGNSIVARKGPPRSRAHRRSTNRRTLPPRGSPTRKGAAHPRHVDGTTPNVRQDDKRDRFSDGRPRCIRPKWSCD